MINRRSFLSLLPSAWVFSFLRGFLPAVKDIPTLREPPDDAAWDWWKNLPRTPLARSDDPMTDSLCHSSAYRLDVTILYNGGTTPEYPRVISPLGVFTVEGYKGTYVHAFCHEREAERTFRIERITALV